MFIIVTGDFVVNIIYIRPMAVIASKLVSRIFHSFVLNDSVKANDVVTKSYTLYAGENRTPSLYLTFCKTREGENTDN